MTHIPRSGPLRLDGRSVPPELAVQRIRTLVRRLRRPNARQIDVMVDRPAVIRAIAAWAASHAAPCALAGDVVQIFLLPANFGEPPAAVRRELEEVPFDETTEVSAPRASASA